MERERGPPKQSSIHKMDKSNEKTAGVIKAPQITRLIDQKTHLNKEVT